MEPPDDFDLVDGLAEVRAGHEDAVGADKVRIVSVPETERLGLAGQVGEVMGETMPSSSGVTDVIGTSNEDYAINVWFDDRGEQFWFAPHLVEPA